MLSSILRICGALFDAFAKTLSIPSAWASPETSMKSVRRSPQKIIRRQLAPLEVYFHSIGVNMPEYRKPPVDEAPK